MKTKIYLLVLFLLTINGFTQETKMSIKALINFSDLPRKTSDTPKWALQFYSNPDQINIENLKKELDIWVIEEKKARKNEKNVKTLQENDKNFEIELKESISENPIVRFAIDFLSKIPNSWIDESGNIVMPTKTEFIKNAENQEIERLATSKQVAVNNWSQIGSIEVVKDNTQVVCSTNIFYISIAPSSTNIRLASSQTGVQYKTTDGGANWDFLNNYTGPSAFHPTDANRIIIASNPIRLSSDGGASWMVRPVTEAANKVIWSKDGNSILIATEQGIYVSGNASAGATFTQTQTGNFMDVDFKPGSSLIAYAITNAGVFYKTTDGGLTWSVKPTNYAANTNKNGFLIAVTAANPDLVSVACLTGVSFDTDNKVELIKSTNGGESFAPLSITNINYSQGFYDFVFEISPTNVNTYFFGVCSFYKSTNGGLNFTLIGGYGGDFGVHPDIQDMVVFNNTVVVATDGGVSESTDSFTDVLNWRSTSKGLNSLDYWGFDLGFNTDQMGGGKYHNGNSIYNPNWNNGKSLFLGGAEEADGKAIFSRPNSLNFSGPNYIPYSQMEKVFKLVDVEYNSIVTNSYPFTLFNNQYNFGARNSDTTSNTTYSNIIYAGYNNDVVVSYDNGISNQVLKNFGSRVWDIKTTRKDAKVIYVMTETTCLWKTVDGGINWTMCNITLNNVDLKSEGIKCYIDVSQINTNEIWLIHSNVFSNARVFKSTDGGQVWTDMLTPTINNIEPRQILHQYGSNGGIYLMGRIGGTAKCYYRNNTMTDWVDYSANLMTKTLNGSVFLKASHFKEKLRVAGSMGIQEISFYEKSNPVAQPTTNVKDICVNQEIKFNDYSILDYSGATWEWSFSKTPTYLNGTTAGSRDPIVKFLSPGVVNATLKVTNSSGISDTKTVTNFVTVNYDSASCLLLNSDQDFDLSCTNNITNLAGIAAGGQILVTNFNNATSGKFLVNLKLYTRCTNVSGSFVATVNLNTNQINVIRYNHFQGSNIDILGNNTNNVTSSNDFPIKISFTLANNSLYLNLISTVCEFSWGNVVINDSCWKPFLDNGDFAELQKCNNTIPQSVAVSDASGILVTDFGNATTGLFYVNVNGFTTCNNVSNSLKAIINLNSDIINVLEYKHYDGSLTSGVSGNETATLNSNSTANAPISYYLSNNKLYAKRPSDPCGGGTTFRVNASCWSAMDDNQNGVDNSIEPSNCNNSLATAIFTNTNKQLVQDFSTIANAQAGVFVKLNINTSCNNTNATIYLSIDFDKNLIHVINYRHFGATTSSTVLNNDTPNVYSESAVNGKLKFILIDKKLYIQRLSTTCAGSNYQITNSCYSLASQQYLAINNFISNSVSNIVAFPNPTTNLFTVDTKSNGSEYSLSIYNIDGKFITSKFEKTGENLLQVNIDQQAEGIYLVILYNKSENKYNYLKIIKK